MSTAPTVSVVMAAYRGATLVGETIESLFAQTLRDWELIVVDDCSPDDTLAVLHAFAARDPRIRVIAAPINEGPVRTRNKAFAEARGRYIAALDQDDLSTPERFALQVAYLDLHTDVVALGTNSVVLEGATTRPSILPPAMPRVLIDWLLLLMNPLAWSSMMIRGDVARTLDPFTRPEILYAEDFDLYHRLRRIGPLARLDEPMMVYRAHPGGASKMFTETMIASATRVLAEAHRPLFGDAAEETAGLVARHVAANHAVADPATLLRLGEVISTLRDDFFAQRDLLPDEREIVAHETSRLWWQIVRGSVRSGLLPLGRAIGATPPAARLGESRPADLLVSGVIGTARALRRGGEARRASA